MSTKASKLIERMISEAQIYHVYFKDVADLNAASKELQQKIPLSDDVRNLKKLFTVNPKYKLIQLSLSYSKAFPIQAIIAKHNGKGEPAFL